MYYCGNGSQKSPLLHNQSPRGRQFFVLARMISNSTYRGSEEFQLYHAAKLMIPDRKCPPRVDGKAIPENQKNDEWR